MDDMAIGLRQLADFVRSPGGRLVVIVGSVFLTGAGTVAGVQRAIDAKLYDWDGQLKALTTTTAALTTTTAALTAANTALADQTRALAGQAQTLSASIDTEKSARVADAADVARKLSDSERSRRAEENGIVQNLNMAVSRIDQLMLRMGWSTPDRRGDATGRGDITQPDTVPPG
jgi:hypothetical protein